MRLLSTDDLRQAYLDFFASKGHAVIPGASLIPENDPTVLFTTAGMHPLVPYLLGEKHPKGTRLVDCQRCIRTQDIEEVGDESHLTFFEMLGNWSLGDYFKQGAIEMSIEFLTEVLQIPKEKLAVSCFEGDQDAPKDEESARVWRSLGIPEERIAFLPKAKNWWGPAGKTGPCGPDTEMFYWIGDGEPQGNPKTHEVDWLEIWNDVFMEYNKREDGTYEPLKQKNVDTGMGLERTAAVLQGVKSVYDTDRMKPIFEKVISLCHNVSRASSFETNRPCHGEGFCEAKSSRTITDGSPQDDTLRHTHIIVDHLRAAVFIIADGIKPSNVDQGYVLRKLVRRAVRSGNQIGIGSDFTQRIAGEIIEQYQKFYPHLKDQQSEVTKTLEVEERQFRNTLNEGIKHFERTVSTLRQAQGDTTTCLNGSSAFHLYDTYGFPLELTRDLAQERGLSIDEAGFKKAFEEHQKLSRAGAHKRFAGGLADHSAETTKLHTATHLLNAALRKVLGNHVWQKGSNVTAERLRFDFSHPQKMTPEEIRKVGELVNGAIKADLPVHYSLMTVEEAKKVGAIGVFGEKYGERIKVYKMGKSPRHGEPFDGAQDRPVEPFSLEICGGPHVAHTGLLGSFKIQKEEAVSAGVRRIKATVSGGSPEVTVAEEQQ